MSLIAQAKADIERITANLGEFGVSMTFTSPLDVEATVTGLHTKHHLGVDTTGNIVNSRNAHISVSEKHLTDADYPVRNASGDVALVGHRVAVKDSTGITKNYVITQCMPDETVGLLLCILGDYE